MSNYEVLVSEGPGETDLLRSVVSRGQHRLVSFRTDEGVIEASIDAEQDLEDAAGVVIRGNIASGPFKGRPFIGTYDPGTHRGCLKLGNVP